MVPASPDGHDRLADLVDERAPARGRARQPSRSGDCINARRRASIWLPAERYTDRCSSRPGAWGTGQIQRAVLQVVVVAPAHTATASLGSTAAHRRYGGPPELAARRTTAGLCGTVARVTATRCGPRRPSGVEREHAVTPGQRSAACELDPHQRDDGARRDVEVHRTRTVMDARTDVMVADDEPSEPADRVVTVTPASQDRKDRRPRSNISDGGKGPTDVL